MAPTSPPPFSTNVTKNYLWRRTIHHKNCKTALKVCIVLYVCVVQTKSTLISFLLLKSLQTDSINEVRVSLVPIVTLTVEATSSRKLETAASPPSAKIPKTFALIEHHGNAMHCLSQDFFQASPQVFP